MDRFPPVIKTPGAPVILITDTESGFALVILQLECGPVRALLCVMATPQTGVQMAVKYSRRVFEL